MSPRRHSFQTGTVESKIVNAPGLVPVFPPHYLPLIEILGAHLILRKTKKIYIYIYSHEYGLILPLAEPQTSMPCL
ncbi:unnamed protein product [Ixodes pacificus]